MEEKEKLENQNTNTAENQNVDGAGKVGTQTTNKDEGTTEKTFSQDEVNEMIKDRLKRERSKLPSKEELQAFNVWKESQKTAEQKQAEAKAEQQRILSENTELKNENEVFKAGVKKDDVEFVAFKVSKMEGDFKENLDKFLKENPKYLGNDEPKIIKKVGSSLSLSGRETTNQSETNKTMNDLIRSVRD